MVTIAIESIESPWAYYKPGPFLLRRNGGNGERTTRTMKQHVLSYFSIHLCASGHQAGILLNDDHQYDRPSCWLPEGRCALKSKNMCCGGTVVLVAVLPTCARSELAGSVRSMVTKHPELHRLVPSRIIKLDNTMLPKLYITQHRTVAIYLVRTR